MRSGTSRRLNAIIAAGLILTGCETAQSAAVPERAKALAELKALDQKPCESVTAAYKRVEAMPPNARKTAHLPIKVCGVLHHGFEDKNLYQNPTSFRNPDADENECITALPIDIKEELATASSGRMVEVTGWLVGNILTQEGIEPGYIRLYTSYCSDIGVIMSTIKVL